MNQSSTTQNRKYSASQSVQCSTSNLGSKPKLFDDDTYDRCTKSLFAATKSCNENKLDRDTSHRQILETYKTALDSIYEDLDKRSNQK